MGKRGGAISPTCQRLGFPKERTKDTKSPRPPLFAGTVAERVVLTMVRLGVGHKLLETIPLGVALPLLDAIRACRAAAPSCWPAEAYLLIGRDDLACEIRQARRPRAAPLVLPVRGPPLSGADDTDGMLALIARSQLRFSRDNRLHEVRDGAGRTPFLYPDPPASSSSLFFGSNPIFPFFLPTPTRRARFAYPDPPDPTRLPRPRYTPPHYTPPHYTPPLHPTPSPHPFTLTLARR